ncbi:MAG: hypothetical protein FWC33_06910 [Candidatus Bathyarchaeota archaeon]|nr:hypothetical protein [Candidatus Termiticorpusculum sp.]
MKSNSTPKEITIGTILCFVSMAIMFISNIGFDEAPKWIIILQLLTAVIGIAFIIFGVQKNAKQKQKSKEKLKIPTHFLNHQ